MSSWCFATNRGRAGEERVRSRFCSRSLLFAAHCCKRSRSCTPSSARLRACCLRSSRASTRCALTLNASLTACCAFVQEIADRAAHDDIKQQLQHDARAARAKSAQTLAPFREFERQFLCPLLSQPRCEHSWLGGVLAFAPVLRALVVDTETRSILLESSEFLPADASALNGSVPRNGFSVNLGRGRGDELAFFAGSSNRSGANHAAKATVSPILPAFAHLLGASNEALWRTTLDYAHALCSQAAARPNKLPLQSRCISTRSRRRCWSTCAPCRCTCRGRRAFWSTARSRATCARTVWD